MDFDCYRTYTTPYPSTADALNGYIRGVCSISSQNSSSNKISKIYQCTNKTDAATEYAGMINSYTTMVAIIFYNLVLEELD